MIPTASQLPIVIACPSAFALEHQRSQSEYAAAGSARHTYLEYVGRIGKAEALLLVPEEHRAECEQIDIEGLPTDLVAEVAFSYDYATGEVRELGRGLARDYSSASDTSICGTIDVLGVSEDSVYVGDYKGHGYVATKGNPQLLFAAMCAAKAYGKSSAVTEIIGVTGGSVRRHSVSVDGFDLADFEHKLRSAIGMMLDIRAGKLTPNYNEGSHCRYCPAFNFCPAKTRLIRQLIDVPDVGTITKDKAAHAYRTYLQMRDMMGKVRSAIHAYAAVTPIDLGDGRVFGSREKQGNESLDGAITHTALTDLYGRDVADLAVTFSATKKGVATAVKAAKEAGADGTLKALNEGVLQTVRLKGGAKRKATRVIDEHKKELTE